MPKIEISEDELSFIQKAIREWLKEKRERHFYSTRFDHNYERSHFEEMFAERLLDKIGSNFRVVILPKFENFSVEKPKKRQKSLTKRRKRNII